MNTFRKLCALILSLCLLAAVLSPALAEETAGDEVTRSDFSLSLLMHADGFPNDGAAHYADWEAFLSKPEPGGRHRRTALSDQGQPRVF